MQAEGAQRAEGLDDAVARVGGGKPWSSISQSCETFSRLLCATRILPCATALVAMSRMNGGSFGIGMPTVIGLVPKRASAPPKGATMEREMTLVKCIEISPSATACSAHWPMRHRWCERPRPMTHMPCCFARAMPISIASSPITWP